MKAAFCGDIHLDGGPDEERAMERMLELIPADVDLVGVLGDIFDGTSSVRQRDFFRRWLNEARKVAASAEIILLRGNHDVEGDLLAFRDNDKALHVLETYGVVEAGGVPWYCLPHFSAGAIALQAKSVAEYAETGTDVVSAMLRSIAAKPKGGLLFHGTVSGARLDNGRIPLENGLHLPLTDLVGLDWPVYGGHYHKHQNVAGQVYYTGSVTRRTFAEQDDDKGFLVHDSSKSGPTFVSLSPRKMFTVSGVWDGKRLVDESGAPIEPISDAEGARVRIRYTVTEELSSTVDVAAIEGLAAGATVKREQDLIRSATVRTEEIVEAQSIFDAVRVWLEADGQSPETIEAVLDLYREISEEVAHEN